MRKMFTLFCLLLSLKGFTQIIYVNKNAAGANDGTSWVDAYTNLQQALTATNSGQIWVAAGTYFPGTDPSNSFILKNGVALYGGFNGSEIILSERNFTTNETILSGDIDGIAGYGGNSYHVVQSSGVNNTSVLDGFTITLGGNSGVSNISGGGMYNIAGAAPTVANCIFIANQVFLSGAFGGAMYNNSASPVITNTSFRENTARLSGGAIANVNGSSLRLSNCSFTGNDLGSLGSGGAIYNTSTLVLDNCFFSRNRATDGGAVYAGPSATFTNCSFEANRGSNGGAVYTGSSATFTNCSFLRDTATSGGAIYNISSLVFTNCIFFRNDGGSGGGIYNQGAVTLKHCSFTQNSTRVAGGGAILNILTSPTTSVLTNCILWGDTGHPGISETQREINGHGTVNYSIVQYGHAGTGNLNTDPLFVRAGKSDLRLSSCSPAIDAGTSTNVPGFDITGNIRPYGTGFDMGAYEYRGETFLFYRDEDNDGFGDPNVSTPACPAPAGYVRDNTDCDDTHATVYPGAQEISDGLDNDCDGQTDEGVQATFYLDADSDGYGDPNTSTTTSPAPAGYVTNNTDCDDQHATVYPGAQEICDGLDNDCDGQIDDGVQSTYYPDADGDGYGDPNTSTTTCPAPSGYVTNNTDCDDNNSEINPATIWYKDEDNDGYSDGTTQTQCARPANYKPASELTAISDCNDGDASVHAQTLYYVDADKDGYGSATTTMLCSSTAPEGYSINNTDCNDGDPAVHDMTQYYVDADKDGYGSATSAMLCSSVAPFGYSTNNTDCNDADGTIHSPIQYYVDSDKDGYGSATTAVLCSPVAPTGYSTNNTDCNDANATLNPATVWILDADADDYYAGNPIVRCTSPGAGYIIRSSQLRGDCIDNNASVNPGAVEVCGNKIDDNCNGIVDEKICYPCRNATNLKTTNITAASAQLNWSAIANPEQWQVQYKTIKPGSKWVDVFVTGNKRSVSISGLLSQQNYIWQIRAKCGKNWTDYTCAAGFKTAASSTLSRSSETTAEPDIISADKVSAHPNPTQGVFNLELRLKSMVSTTAVISLTDITGRVVYKQKASIVNGALNDQIKIPDDAAAGVYVMQVVVDQQSYQFRLVYVK